MSHVFISTHSVLGRVEYIVILDDTIRSPIRASSRLGKKRCEKRKQLSRSPATVLIQTFVFVDVLLTHVLASYTSAWLEPLAIPNVATRSGA